MIYLWKPEYGDTPSTLFSHNVASHASRSKITTIKDFFHENVRLGPFRLTDSDSTHLVGLSGSNQLVVFPADSNSEIETLPVNTNRLFYNSRFPQYAFTNLHETSVQRIDADLTITDIDLAPFFEEHPREWIGHITPG